MLKQRIRNATRTKWQGFSWIPSVCERHGQNILVINNEVAIASDKIRYHVRARCMALFPPTG